MKKYLIIITLLLVSGLSFFSGMKYQEKRLPSGQAALFRQTGGPSGPRFFMSAGRGDIRPIAGEIISSDDQSVTVKLTDGSSKIVLFSEKTAINKASEGSRSDIKVGERVAIFGTENPDGSFTAQNIQLNPQPRIINENPQVTSKAE